MLTNKTVKESNIKPEDWYTYFRELYNPNTNVDQSINNPNIIVRNDDVINDEIEQMMNMPITVGEIDDVLNKLKVGKASGSDGIGPDFYKVNCTLLREFLFVLFNKVYDCNVYPIEWSKSLIFPLHKKGSVSNVQNYRGISLLNIVCAQNLELITGEKRNIFNHYYSALSEISLTWGPSTDQPRTVHSSHST